MVQVTALVHKENGKYGVSFPDFPGATTVADSMGEAAEKASLMLSFHVGGMIADGEALPQRLRTPAEIVADPALAKDVFEAEVMLISVDLPPRAGVLVEMSGMGSAEREALPPGMGYVDLKVRGYLPAALAADLNRRISELSTGSFSSETQGRPAPSRDPYWSRVGEWYKVRLSDNSSGETMTPDAGRENIRDAILNSLGYPDEKKVRVEVELLSS